MKADNTKIRIPLLVPLGLAILVLLVVSVAAIYWQQWKYSNSSIQVRLEEVRRQLDVQIKEDSRLLNTITDVVQNDKNIRTAWLEKDRSALLAHSDLILKDIRNKYGITHFYFHEPNEVCFLRVHDPTNYGDRIHRFTIDEAVRKKEPVYGITLATFGTFSLRYAQPWYIDDKLVGFVELGRKIEDIASQLKEVLEVELFFVVKKPCLYREDWEHGLKTAGRQGNWELMQNLVITDSTLEKVPQEFPAIVETAYTAQKTTFDIPADNQMYSAGFVPLPDAAGNEIGKIVVMKDVTANRATLRNMLIILITASVLIGGTLLIIFYWYIRRIENVITSACETKMEKHGQTKANLSGRKIKSAQAYSRKTASFQSYPLPCQNSNNDCCLVEFRYYIFLCLNRKKPVASS